MRSSSIAKITCQPVWSVESLKSIKEEHIRAWGLYGEYLELCKISAPVERCQSLKRQTKLMEIIPNMNR